jgi:hypothetical protein
MNNHSKPIRFAAALTVLAAALSLASLVSCAGLPSRTSPHDGSWLSEAHAYRAEIRGSRIELYDVSEAGSTKLMSGRIEGDRVALTGIPGLPFSGRLAQEGAELRIALNETIHIDFRRLPEGSALPPAVPDTPEGNFDALAATFAERYAFFDARGVDWGARVAALKAKAASAGDDRELFALLSGLLSPLDDSHVGLYDMRGGEYAPASPIAWEGSAQRFVDTIKTGYLAAAPEKAAGGKLAWGRLKAGPAYVVLTAMEGYANEVSDPGARAEAEAKALDEGLDRALAAAAGAPGLILDLRFNGGGYDAHALRVAARFARERTLGYSRSIPKGGAPDASEDFYVEPARDRPSWTGPLVVLVSRRTTSAAEVLCLCLGALPGTTFVGETTNGAFSDMLYKRLPNGWIFTLSNEEYRDHEGRCFEGRGIEPGIAAPMDLGAAALGCDPALDAAVALIADRH